RDHFAEARVFDAFAQVVEPLEKRHPGLRELLEMEAEVDEVRARDAPAADEAAPLLGGRAGDEVEAHAREAWLEAEEIHRLDAPGDVLALRVHRAVCE